MKKNVKNVAYIQDPFLLTNEQIIKYMGDIKNLTSANPVEIYKFILCCNKYYKITNFCLNVNSGILKFLNTMIQNNRKLDKCIFVATRSTANSLRDIIAKNIYFSLSSLNTILYNYKDIDPYNIMTIVTDTSTPFYDQIYIEGPKPAYRISELTVEKVNEFVDNGNALGLLISLNNNVNQDEFKKLNSILLNPACKYKNFATFIELENEDISTISILKTKLASINNVASNVSICGLTENYPDINYLTLYQNSAIQLVNNYSSWKFFYKNSTLFNRFNIILPAIRIIDSSKYQLLSTFQRAIPLPS